MSLQELQQKVSVCLDEITRLNQENTRQIETNKCLAEALRAVTVELNKVIKENAQLNAVAANDRRCLIDCRNRICMLQSSVSHFKNTEKLRKERNVTQADEKTPFMGKGVVYSAVTGNYDSVKEIRFKNPNYDYIMFTDDPLLKSDTWEVRLIDNPDNLDSVRLARRVKILGYEYLADYDYSIWVDGKMEIVGDLEEYIHRYRRSRPMLCFNHYFNDCIYKEKVDCETLKKDDPNVMNIQIDRYREEGYPSHNGLVETAVLVRELHDRKVQTVMRTWWNEIVHCSFRDQLSFNYSCWKCGFLYDTSDLYIYLNDYVVVYDHNKS